MNFILHTQQPKPKTIGKGYVSIDREGLALFFDEKDRLLAELRRIRIEFMSSHGFMLSGMEQVGFDKTGRCKYNYQEWFVAFANSKEE